MLVREGFKKEESEVHKLYNLLSQSPEECRDYLIKVLEESLLDKIKQIDLPKRLNASDLKNHFRLVRDCKVAFPTVFKPIKIVTTLKPKFHLKMYLRIAKVNFTCNSDNVIQFNSLSYSNFEFYIHLLMSSCELIRNDHKYSNIPILESQTYLTNAIGTLYTHGQLIDFVDNLYDQYKHCGISPMKFRKIFRCFGANTEAIGNDAFDSYMKLRDTDRAWHKAIKHFLLKQLNLPEPLSNKLTCLIYK